MLLSGCDQIDNYIASISRKQHTADREASITKLQSQVNSQLEELTTLKGEVEDLKFKASMHDVQLETVDVSEAVVSEGGGYGIAKTKQGIFLITIEKLEPYLDGYKATLHVGNTSTLTMLGGEFEVKWGLPWDSPNKKPKEIWASRKSKKFSFTHTFSPGAYTAIDVALTPARPEEVKTLNVAPLWNRISMRLPAPNR